MRAALGDDATIMVDANQAWSPDEAAARIAELAPFRPHWIEEPIAADEPHAAWRALARASGVPLAAGENLRGQQAFDDAIDAGYLAFVQPDVGKWGGISGGRDVARHAAARGVAYCPHWLAGGVGPRRVDARARRRAAARTAMPKSTPIRIRCARRCSRSRSSDGRVTLSDAPGLGVEPDLRGSPGSSCRPVEDFTAGR